MGYSLSWYLPEQILYLELQGQMTPQEMAPANHAVLGVFDIYHSKVHLLINATDLLTSYHTADQLRETQKYMNHPRLNSISVVANNKLIRLVTLMAFCMAWAKFTQFQTIDMAESVLQHRGIVT